LRSSLRAIPGRLWPALDEDGVEARFCLECRGGLLANLLACGFLRRPPLWMEVDSNGVVLMVILFPPERIN